MNYIKYRVKNITKLNTRQIGGSIERFSTTADINYNNELFMDKCCKNADLQIKKILNM